jgi:hypothetical protein
MLWGNLTPNDWLDDGAPRTDTGKGRVPILGQEGVAGRLESGG